MVKSDPLPKAALALSLKIKSSTLLSQVTLAAAPVNVTSSLKVVTPLTIRLSLKVVIPVTVRAPVNVVTPVTLTLLVIVTAVPVLI